MFVAPPEVIYLRSLLDLAWWCTIFDVCLLLLSVVYMSAVLVSLVGTLGALDSPMLAVNLSFVLRLLCLQPSQKNSDLNLERFVFAGSRASIRDSAAAGAAAAAGTAIVSFFSL